MKLKRDWLTAVLVGLFATFQAIAIGIVRQLTQVSSTSGASAGGTSAGAETQASDPQVIVELIGIAAVEIAVIVLLYRGYRRLPERWQTRVRTGLKYGIIVALNVVLWWSYIFWIGPEAEDLFIFAGAVVLWYARRRFDTSAYRWIPFNLVTLVFGIVIVVSASLALAPELVVVLMGILLIYDHVAVNLTEIMHDLVEFSTSMMVPNMVIVPTALSFELSSVREFVRGDIDERPEHLGFLIGLGDFAVPTIFVCSVVAAAGAVTIPALAAAVGSLVGIVVVRSVAEQKESGVPALVYLVPATVIGWAIAATAIWLTQL